jgi:photosystem II stability/assembly factor-like uncharacterized protein
MKRLCLVMALCMSTAWSSDDSWKAPLSEKEGLIEAGIVLKHNIQGLYPSLVEIPRHNAPADIYTTNPFADIQHAVCWTANYLAGLSFKVAVLEREGAAQGSIDAIRARADEVFEAIYRCQRVTGRRGLQARGYLLGHGEVYAERAGHGKLPFWRQGEVDGQAYRWVGDPSHHNYSDSVHGLIQYYTLAATGTQKERAREAIDALVSYWVDNDLNIDKFDRSLPSVPILGFTDGKTLNMRVLMAIAGAKYAHFATGKEKFNTVYQQLLEQFDVRNLSDAFETEKDFDDGEHVFSHLEVLFRIEEDPELLSAYRHVADALWANHKNDAQSLFTYIYHGLAPDAPERDAALSQALLSLQTFPSDMTQRPQMSSLFPERKAPYRVHQAAWDNEYMWKGNLLRPDGWLSGLVVDVAVSAEDPMVIYAVGQDGEVYQSRDGAASWDQWYPITKNFLPAIKDIDVGARSRVLAVAASDGFYLSTSAGSAWKRLSLPADTGAPVSIDFDAANGNILLATTTRGAYRSKDFDEEFLGQAWDCLSAGLPEQPGRFMVAGDRVYALLKSATFTRKLDASEWRRTANRGLGEYAKTYPWFLINPTQPDHLLSAYSSNYGGAGTFSILQESEDAGESWSNDLPVILSLIQEHGFAGIFTVAVRGEIKGAVQDPDNVNNLYAVGNRGVMKSTDRGKTWTERNGGMRIPQARHVFKPRHSAWVFAATPGGLQLSKDDGETWEDANLWFQFGYNTRRELGGAAFIDAYWRGRYYGFIDKATANQPWNEEGQ